MNKSEEEKRYTRESILRSERVYGYGYQSPGASETTIAFAKTLGFSPEWKVLDIGCGLGGAVNHISKTYGSHVVGLDISEEMIKLCNEREHDSSKVTFLVGDACNARLFSESEFDLIWSRDAILYVPDKAQIFKNLFNWLKPGGKLFITDFGSGDARTLSPEYQQYLANAHYTLRTTAEYAQDLTTAGFADVHVEDITNEFIRLNEQDLQKVIAGKHEWSEADFKYVTERWQKKIQFSKAHELLWYKATATKSK